MDNENTIETVKTQWRKQWTNNGKTMEKTMKAKRQWKQTKHTEREHKV